MIAYKDYINNIHHFPIEGIIYRIFNQYQAMDYYLIQYKELGELIDENNLPLYWVGIESRGFLFENVGNRIWWRCKNDQKKGKLPNNKLVSVKYGLEYGKDELRNEHFN